MLRIAQVALEIITDFHPFLDALRRKNPHLHDQLERSLTTTYLAIAEGSRSRGKNRGAHYARGAASMDESIAVADVALARGYAAPLDHVVREKMKHVVGALVLCSR